jgi:O-antigen/teichoic acid export membrane protein
VAAWLLGDDRYWPAVLAFAVVMPFGMVAPLFTSLFTARRRFNLVALTGIIGTVAGAAVFIPAAWLFGLWGGLIGVVVVYPLVFVIGYAISRRHASTDVLSHWSQATRRLVPSIAKFYPMLLVHSASLPLAMILVRGMLMDEFGDAQAGLWQATTRLSDIYTMVFLTTLSMYSLPTLAGARSATEYCQALRRMIVIGAAAMSATIAVLYLARDLIVNLVFTNEFAAVRDLWGWRLVGDLFFIAGWPMRSALVARGRQLAYIGVELAAGAGLLFATWALLDREGMAAANVAHAVVWGSVFAVLVILHWRQLFLLRDRHWTPFSQPATQ